MTFPCPYPRILHWSILTMLFLPIWIISSPRSPLFPLLSDYHSFEIPSLFTNVFLIFKSTSLLSIPLPFTIFFRLDPQLLFLQFPIKVILFKILMYCIATITFGGRINHLLLDPPPPHLHIPTIVSAQ